MEGAHRLGQKLGAFWPRGPSRLVPERGTQVVLGRGPVLPSFHSYFLGAAT